MDDLNAWWAFEGVQIARGAKTMERQNATVKGLSSCDEGRRERISIRLEIRRWKEVCVGQVQTEILAA
jgi:hypothetical protein